MISHFLAVNWVSDMLRLIACSRQGLTETEIQAIQNSKIRYSPPVNGFNFARLRSATFDALFERTGGLLNFFHCHLRKAVESYLLGRHIVHFHHSYNLVLTEFYRIMMKEYVYAVAKCKMENNQGIRCKLLYLGRPVSQ